MQSLMFCGYELKSCGTEALPRYELEMGPFWVAVAYHPGREALKWSASFCYPPPKENRVFCEVGVAPDPETAVRALEEQVRAFVAELVLLTSEGEDQPDEEAA